jgi:hypothetical protein
LWRDLLGYLAAEIAVDFLTGHSSVLNLVEHGQSTVAPQNWHFKEMGM